MKSPIAIRDRHRGFRSRNQRDTAEPRTDDRAPNRHGAPPWNEINSDSAIEQAPVPEININRVQLKNQGCQVLSDRHLDHLEHRIDRNDHRPNRRGMARQVMTATEPAAPSLMAAWRVPVLLTWS